ncbi:MAG: pantetheine-phosphate adenylyltransferase [Chloroflexi bacterium]|nr:pantetheine-phosphate adenylyltransferase [Chloroflexota bacterium]
MAIAVYPGTFDPPTKGHIDIAVRAARMFDHVYVGCYDVPPKKLWFDTKERVDLWNGALPSDVKNITVVGYTGLTVDFARAQGASIIVRGLRAVTDFMYEFDMELMNKKMAPEIDEIYLITALEFLFVSSSRIKEVAELGQFVPDLVPDNVLAAIKQKLSRD